MRAGVNQCFVTRLLCVLHEPALCSESQTGRTPVGAHVLDSGRGIVPRDPDFAESNRLADVFGARDARGATAGAFIG